MTGKAGRRDWGWIRKRSSGRYQAGYIGPDHVRHFAPETFELKSDAEEWLANERRDIEQAKSNVRKGKTPKLEWVTPRVRELAYAAIFDDGKTVENYGQQWIEQRNLKPRTIAQYQAIFAAHIVPKLGAIPVRQLNTATVRNWYATTLVDKPTYRSHAYGLLHAICKTAVADDLLDKNPCMIEGATSVKTKRESVVPTVEQMAVIADKIEPKFKAFVIIASWCGLRFGEVIELRTKDFALDCEVINLTRGATHLTAKQAQQQDGKTCVVGPPKSGKPRKVIVPEFFRPDIAHHIDTYAEPLAEGGRLFVPVRKGCHITDRVIRDEFRKACAAAGVSGMTIHDMRHFAGHQTARFANLPETMARLGHSTQSASLRYQGAVSGRDVEIAASLSALANLPKDEAQQVESALPTAPTD